MYCSTALMPTVSSTLLRLQPAWQGAGHTRPIIEGTGLASVERRNADSCIPVPLGVFPRRAARLAGRGLVHVDRALVGLVAGEDLLLQGGPFVVAVLELAEGVP